MSDLRKFEVPVDGGSIRCEMTEETYNDLTNMGINIEEEIAKGYASAYGDSPVVGAVDVSINIEKSSIKNAELND